MGKVVVKQEARKREVAVENWGWSDDRERQWKRKSIGRQSGGRRLGKRIVAQGGGTATVTGH